MGAKQVSHREPVALALRRVLHAHRDWLSSTAKLVAGSVLEGLRQALREFADTLLGVPEIRHRVHEDGWLPRSDLALLLKATWFLYEDEDAEVEDVMDQLYHDDETNVFSMLEGPRRRRIRNLREEAVGFDELYWRGASDPEQQKATLGIVVKCCESIGARLGAAVTGLRTRLERPSAAADVESSGGTHRFLDKLYVDNAGAVRAVLQGRDKEVISNRSNTRPALLLRCLCLKRLKVLSSRDLAEIAENMKRPTEGLVRRWAFEMRKQFRRAFGENAADWRHVVKTVFTSIEVGVRKRPYAALLEACRKCKRPYGADEEDLVACPQCGAPRKA